MPIFKKKTWRFGIEGLCVRQTKHVITQKKTLIWADGRTDISNYGATSLLKKTYIIKIVFAYMYDVCT